MVRLRATKSLKYKTRRLMAGDEFEAKPQYARVLKAIGKAEDAPPEPPAPPAPRRGRPPRVMEPEAEPVSAPTEPSLEEKTVSELRELAEERGLELPTGYVRRDTLVERLSQAGEDDGA